MFPFSIDHQIQNQMFIKHDGVGLSHSMNFISFHFISIFEYNPTKWSWERISVDDSSDLTVVVGYWLPVSTLVLGLFACSLVLWPYSLLASGQWSLLVLLGMSLLCGQTVPFELNGNCGLWIANSEQRTVNSTNCQMRIVNCMLYTHCMLCGDYGLMGEFVISSPTVALFVNCDRLVSVLSSRSAIAVSDTPHITFILTPICLPFEGFWYTI